MQPSLGQASQPNSTNELLLSKEQYQHIFTALDLGVLLVDLDLRILMANPALQGWLVTLGFIAHDDPLQGRSLADFTAVLPERSYQAYQRVFDTGKTTISEETITFNGNPVEYEIRRIPITTAGAVTHILTLITPHGPREAFETELRTRERYLQTLNNITQAALRSGDYHVILQEAADQLCDLFQANGCYMTLWDADRHEVIPVAAAGSKRETYPHQERSPGKDTLTRSVLEAGHALVIANASHSPYVSRSLSVAFNVVSALGLPLINSEHKLGAALIAYDHPHNFTPTEIAEGEQAAGQIALALTQSHLMENISRQLNELTILHAVANAGAEALSADELIERAIGLLEEAFNAANFGVLMLEEAEQVLRPHPSYRFYGVPSLPNSLLNAVVPLGTGLSGAAAQTGEMVYAPDVLSDNRYLAFFPNIRSELSIPLRVSGRVIGVVNAEREHPNAFSPADERLLQTFTSQLATAIEKLRLFESEYKRRQEAETLRESMAALASDLDLGQVLNQILTQLHNVIPYGSASIFLQEDEGYRLVAMTGEIAQTSTIGSLFSTKDQLFADIKTTGKAIYLPDAQLDPRFANWGDSAQIHGWMGVPIISRARILGFITLDHACAGEYGADQAALVQVFANQAAAAIENARLFEETNRRASQLAVLAQVSEALRNARTRSEMLPVILSQSMRVLQASGAVIASWDPITRIGTMDLGAGEWMRMTGAGFYYGEGLCGSVVATGKPYLTESAQTSLHIHQRSLIGECTSVACVPLIAESRTIGALAVGSCAPIGEDRLHLLTSIADIAGSAMHRASLHEEAEHYAQDLADAYDATIEGWSRALELRDQETEGHARRVVDGTLRLAFRMEIPEGELIHIRRGVLLHDIGKMGIPDSILLKQGPLTDEEWVTMRRHPEYAYDLLSPIAHLRPALDIPYCHHEKWDGSGYPRGLKGEAIPLAARIFSIIDVWDALRSDRPYRLAWPEEKTIAYLREESGRSFDPEVVRNFMKMIGQAGR